MGRHRRAALSPGPRTPELGPQGSAGASPSSGDDKEEEGWGGGIARARLALALHDVAREGARVRAGERHVRLEAVHVLHGRAERVPQAEVAVVHC